MQIQNSNSLTKAHGSTNDETAIHQIVMTRNDTENKLVFTPMIMLNDYTSKHESANIKAGTVIATPALKNRLSLQIEESEVADDKLSFNDSNLEI